MVAKARALPFSGGRCYACDAAAVGLRDRRPEGGDLEAACARHADPRVPTFEACCLCGGHVRTGSLVIDGEYVHRTCYAEACA